MRSRAGGVARLVEVEPTAVDHGLVGANGDAIEIAVRRPAPVQGLVVVDLGEDHAGIRDACSSLRNYSWLLSNAVANGNKQTKFQDRGYPCSRSYRLYLTIHLAIGI